MRRNGAAMEPAARTMDTALSRMDREKEKTKYSGQAAIACATCAGFVAFNQRRQDGLVVWPRSTSGGRHSLKYLSTVELAVFGLLQWWYLCVGEAFRLSGGARGGLVVWSGAQPIKSAAHT